MLYHQNIVCFFFKLSLFYFQLFNLFIVIVFNLKCIFRNEEGYDAFLRVQLKKLRNKREKKWFYPICIFFPSKMQSN